MTETPALPLTMSPSMERMAEQSGKAAALLRALSNQPRLLVMCHLAEMGELSVGALIDRIGISQSALSQHLAKLREQDLVAFRRDAQTLYYRIADPRAGRLLDLLHDMFCPAQDQDAPTQGYPND